MKINGIKLLLSIALLFISLVFYGQSKRVLFLGNSYTYSNNLPQLSVDLAASVNDTLFFISNSPGGYTLEGHSSNSTSLEYIMQGGWDFVVLQEQSQRPALPINQVEVDVFPYAMFLDSIINVYNPCGETMFFRTWGRKNGDSYFCPTWPPVCTYDGMDSLLQLRYQMMADSNQALVSPVGSVWKYIREMYPEIELYQGDESHPSAEGSYAAACCFYTAIFRDDPTLISYNFTIDPLFAQQIRMATKLVVYDSLLNWNIGKFDVSSEFIYEHVSGTTYQFTNLSNNTNGQTWYFGTETDTTSSPGFTFPEGGTFTVQLITYNHCDTLVSSQEIFVAPIGITNGDNSQEEINIFPNPAKDKIYVSGRASEQISIVIYNCRGEKVMSFQSRLNNEIHLNKLGSGLYYLEIKTGEFHLIKKLIKR